MNFAIQHYFDHYKSANSDTVRKGVMTVAQNNLTKYEYIKFLKVTAAYHQKLADVLLKKTEEIESLNLKNKL